MVPEDFVYVFVDESGDLGKFGSKYFSIACLSTKNLKQIERIIKTVRQKKLKKTLKQLAELKGNNSSPVIRKFVLEKVSKAECTIDVITIPKEKVKNYLYDNKNRLYNYLFGLIVEELDFKHEKLVITLDKKDGNRPLQDDLTNYITKKIKEIKFSAKVDIRQVESHCNRCLQVIDFIAWAVNRKYSFQDDSYFKIFEKKIRTIKNLWE